MQIKYQGETVEATAKTVAEFLSVRGVDPAKANAVVSLLLGCEL